jgi:50S ribosomal subunit-associated GTPase HflX
MIETTNMTNKRALAMHAGGTQGAGEEYYRAYYRELVKRHASRTDRNRRLDAIKAERRRARRDKWLKGIKSLAGVLVSQEAAVN